MNQSTYHIYGRKSYAEPLTLIAQINHADEGTLKSAILEKEESEEWVELVAIPESEILWARTSEAEA